MVGTLTQHCNCVADVQDLSEEYSNKDEEGILSLNHPAEST